MTGFFVLKVLGLWSPAFIETLTIIINDRLSLCMKTGCDP